MNPYLPANLSPLAKAPRRCALPYGLTWDDLRPFLPDFAERGGAQAQAFAAYEKQGLNGGANSCILTLRYPSRRDRFRSETVFIKHTVDLEKAEAQKYQYLASHDLPTPRLLAAIHRGGSETIILEFLPTIGIDFRDANEVNSLLHLVAELNSLPQPPDLFNESPEDPQVESRAAFDKTVLDALTKMSRDTTLPVTMDAPRWFDAYQMAQTASRSMPLAVNHGEFYFQQVGWTQPDATRRLVIFDLETMSLRPRFTDIASVLYPLSVYTGRAEVELFKVYLDRLRQLCPIAMDLGEALRELRLIRVTMECHSLPWHVREAERAHTRGGSNALTRHATCLRDDMLALELLPRV